MAAPASNPIARNVLTNLILDFEGAIKYSAPDRAYTALKDSHLETKGFLTSLDVTVIKKSVTDSDIMTIIKLKEAVEEFFDNSDSHVHKETISKEECLKLFEEWRTKVEETKTEKNSLLKNGGLAKLLLAPHTKK